MFKMLCSLLLKLKEIKNCRKLLTNSTLLQTIDNKDDGIVTW